MTKEFKPLIANLRKLDYGYYLQSNSYESILLENDLDEYWTKAIDISNEGSDIIYIGDTSLHEKAFLLCIETFWKEDKKLFNKFLETTIEGLMSESDNKDYSKLFNIMNNFGISLNRLTELQDYSDIQEKNQTDKLMKDNKIFISHSSKDIIIVRSFVEKVLQLGLDISAERIFCSSMEGYGIKSGQYMPDRLKEEINKSCLAILFISPDYKSSEICLNEIGAAWATLDKEFVIPMLLPGVSFNDLGFLDLNRLGLKISQRNDIIKFVQDCKDQLNPNFDLPKLHTKIEEFVSTLDSTKIKIESTGNSDSEESDNDWQNCFSKNLYPFSEILRKAIPALNDGIHKINSLKIQNQILTDLSKAKFLKNFWYMQAEGDYYIEKIKQLSSGNWLISSFNWEVKISEMWICMDISLQYEFILIKSEKQDPYKIDSDVGGLSYNVGILNDGKIVSENERLNGYAIINDESINLAEKDVEPRVRDRDSHWVFLVSDYHKAGYNADETIDFCKKLDSKEVDVNEENIKKFLRPLNNHPTVVMYN